MAELTPKTPSHYPWEPTRQLIPGLVITGPVPLLLLLLLLKKVKSLITFLGWHIEIKCEKKVSFREGIKG